MPDTGEEGIFFEGKTPIVDFNRFFTPTGERAYIFAFESRDALIHFYDKGYNHTFWIGDGPAEKIRNDKAESVVIPLLRKIPDKRASSAESSPSASVSASV